MTFSGRPTGNRSEQITQRELRAYEERDDARAELKAATLQVDAYQQSVEALLTRLNEARAIARRLAAALRATELTVTGMVTHGAFEGNAKKRGATLADFDALPWAKDDA